MKLNAKKFSKSSAKFLPNRTEPKFWSLPNRNPNQYPNLRLNLYRSIYSSLYPNLYLVTPFSAHFISDHRISDQKVRTVMVRAIVRVRVRVMVRVWVRVRVRVRLGGAVVRNAVGRKVGNPYILT